MRIFKNSVRKQPPVYPSSAMLVSRVSPRSSSAPYSSTSAPLCLYYFPPLCWKRPRARNGRPIFRFCFRTEFLKICGCGFSKTRSENTRQYIFLRPCIHQRSRLSRRGLGRQHSPNEKRSAASLSQGPGAHFLGLELRLKLKCHTL